MTSKKNGFERKIARTLNNYSGFVSVQRVTSTDWVFVNNRIRTFGSFKVLLKCNDKIDYVIFATDFLLSIDLSGNNYATEFRLRAL